MAKFLIEVPHEESAQACARTIDAFLRSGSHFVTNADWGCKDGEHKAWMVVEVPSREDARSLLPIMFRAQAKIVQLNAFVLEEIQGYLHPEKP